METCLASNNARSSASAKTCPETKAMLKSVVQDVQSIDAETPHYTISDWEGDVETAKMQHSSVAEIWKTLAKFSENFELQLEEDKLLLMNMFAKISGGLLNQTATLHQIAQQSEQVGKAFDKYSPGKELKLPLLVVSHQQPDLFLA